MSRVIIKANNFKIQTNDHDETVFDLPACRIEEAGYVSRQQILKEVFEVVVFCAIQQAGGELDDSVCVSDIKKALKERFGDE